MHGQTTEDLVQAIETLPVPERLRLLERVLHNLASHSESSKIARNQDHPSLLGWLADAPELADAIIEHSNSIRAREFMRTWPDEDAS
jgi:hypothetical protein